jgi:hypothetical protein
MMAAVTKRLLDTMPNPTAMTFAAAWAFLVAGMWYLG